MDAELEDLESQIAPLQAQIDQLTRQFWVTRVQIKANRYDLSASHYRQVEPDEAYYEKPQVTMERLLTLEDVMTQQIHEIEELLKRLGDPPNENIFMDCVGGLGRLLESFAKIDYHYLRKENQLFPMLESHDVSGPSQVMWGIHDDIRTLLKKASEQLSQKEHTELVTTLKELIPTTRQII